MHDAVDPVRQQLGWYMRNCAKSAAAIRLEFVLLERLNVLKGIPSHDEDLPDLSKPKQRRALMRELLHAVAGLFRTGRQQRKPRAKRTVRSRRVRPR